MLNVEKLSVGEAYKMISLEVLLKVHVNHNYEGIQDGYNGLWS